MMEGEYACTCLVRNNVPQNDLLNSYAEIIETQQTHSNTHISYLVRLCVVGFIVYLCKLKHTTISLKTVFFVLKKNALNIYNICTRCWQD